MSINEIVSLYAMAKEQEKKAKQEKENLKALILEYAKDSDIFETENFTVTIKKTESKRLDTKALYKDFPDIKSVYEKVTESVSIDTFEKAKAENVA